MIILAATNVMPTGWILMTCLACLFLGYMLGVAERKS